METKFESWKTVGEWTPQVSALLKSGWLGVGYTMINENETRQRAAYASDSPTERQSFDAWVRDRMCEGYMPALRYYIAKSPCRMSNSEFGGPVVLRHTSLGYEVIVEMVLGMAEPGDLPKTLLEILGSKTELDTFCRCLDFKGTCARLALIADAKNHEGPSSSRT